ncbi:MAG TPA: Rieske 2Fe-2S domain-containing protein [Chloroflexota bacterium]|nr:Rieske 2Fe-2S domain-containing protein [Chloroflexota bacterium]
MLTREENELITRVGPGTPMGDVLRRYWMPALLARDIPEPDCPPVRVKLLGEELVAFRDTDGHVGLLEEYCPHRLASMFLGRNEECGLRCVYHGWKFDVEGTCVDMPNEPATSRFKEKVRMQSHPTVELGGVVGAYLGPVGKRPRPPAMEWLRGGDDQHFVSKTWEYCNWFQAMEGGIDTCHSSFLHNNDLSRRGLRQIDTAPQLEVERTPYGYRYSSTRDLGERGDYVRVYQFIAPFQQFRGHRLHIESGEDEVIPTVRGHMWVPMDDENTMIYNWMSAADPAKPLTPEFVTRQETQAGRGPTGEVGEVRRRTRENDWLIDRQVQRTQTYTGIEGVNSQDLAVQESMGRIVDRSREHLGTTDKAIIATRRILLDAIKEVANGGDPPGVDPDSYRNVRATDTIVPKELPWQEATRDLLVAVR